MTPLHYPAPASRAYRYPFGQVSLRFGDALVLSPHCLTSLESCATLGVDDDSAYAALTRQLLPYVGRALSEAFPAQTGQLSRAQSGEFRVSPADQPVHLQAVDEAMRFVLAVERGDRVGNRRLPLSLFVGYCISALVARVLAGFPSECESGWLAIWFLAVQVVRAGFVTKQEHGQFVRNLEAARQLERHLPLAARLGLDGDWLLPSEKVPRPGKDALLPTLPWPGALGAQLPSLTAFEAAERLGCDLYVEHAAPVSHAIGRLGLQPVALAQTLSDLNGLLESVTRAVGEADSHLMALTTETGLFRSSSRRAGHDYRLFHIWRPLSGNSPIAASDAPSRAASE